MMNRIKELKEDKRVNDRDVLNIEITPEEMDELLRDLPAILQELNENVINEKVSDV